ncbi:MAG: hypothetical protein SPJ29_03980 [Phocaeicola sp.]|nr:hypothetical protein [Phocaeicola sp.]MDD7447652.1 hypothetical protein [Prevotellaceae bacterium]MDY3913421.1 hypothetical protein [Phocaeicola sp.]MDY5938896.1 hypothetical protein [Phocaeicola sp.]
MKKIIICCTVVLSLLIVGCAKTEVEQPVVKKNTITVSVSMPDQQDKSRGYALAKNNGATPGIILSWDKTDKLKLCFEHKGKFYHKEASIKPNSITNEGKNAKFIIEIPNEIPSTEHFNLYAIYQKTDEKKENGGHFKEKSAKYILEDHEESCLTLSNEKNTGVIRPALKSVLKNTMADKLQHLSFQHIGWIMAVHIKNTSNVEKKMPQSFQFKYEENVSTSSRIYNGVPSINPVSIDLTNDNIESLVPEKNQKTILYDFTNSPLRSKTLKAGESVIAYRWLISSKKIEVLEAILEVAENLKALELKGDSALDEKEVDAGIVYHIPVEWSENKINWGKYKNLFR